MPSTNCYHCEYLSKRAGAGNYFIYKCSYWGIVTQNVLPHTAVISSIGRRCPFFKPKKVKSNDIKNNNKKINDDNDLDSGFDIIA